METFAERPVVVAVDGSAAALHAVRWAAEAAALRESRLRIVTAYGFAVTEFPLTEAERASLARSAEYILAKAKEHAMSVTSKPRVETAMMLEAPVPVVLKESRDASMVVLGSKGRSGLGRLLLGSTASTVTRHAACPVVVVRGDPESSTVDGPVVVGVDGSQSSEQAIAAAFEEASLHGTSLVAVHSWLEREYDYLLGRLAEREAEGKRMLADRMAGWQEKYPDVPMKQALVRGDPRLALVERSRHARLLVVGSRGLGGFAGLVLGSVSHAVLHHATCSVMVVQQRRRADAD